MIEPEIENFVNVIGFEGLYKISDLGRVMNKRGRILKTAKCRKEHVKISLSDRSLKTTFTVSHLVARHFLKSYTGIKQIVSHKDGNKSNNKFHNLEITEPKGNPKTEAENVCYKVFDARNRLLLVTPLKASAKKYVREQTGVNNYKTVLDTLIEGQFIIRKHVQKQIY